MIHEQNMPQPVFSPMLRNIWPWMDNNQTQTTNPLYLGHIFPFSRFCIYLISELILMLLKIDLVSGLSTIKNARSSISSSSFQLVQFITAGERLREVYFCLEH